VLASANPGKAAEIRALLRGVELLERPASLGEVAETGSTLLEKNKKKKRSGIVKKCKNENEDKKYVQEKRCKIRE
jgi:inosine/xanthosine triphosphate pyrophosphatase family protein